jgi:hypothetical protein
MTTSELIAALHDVDPEGDSEVFVYICRRYGGHQSTADEVRRFRADERRIYICDARDEEM